MGLFQEIKRRAKAGAPPTVFLLLTAYFGWQATQGEHGLETAALRQKQLLAVEGELARVRAEQQGWERRVLALHTDRLDLDMLDEQARTRLNLAAPGEIVVSYPQDKRLF